MTRSIVLPQADLEPQAALLWLLGRADEFRSPGDMIGPSELLRAALERPAWLGLTEREASSLRARLEELPSSSRRSRHRQRRRLDALIDQAAVGSAFPTWHSMLIAALKVPGPQLVALLDHRSVVMRYLRTGASTRDWSRRIARWWRHHAPFREWKVSRLRRTRAQRWVDRLRLEEWQQARGRTAAGLAFAAALPGILMREGVRIVLVRCGGGSVAYRTPVLDGGHPIMESWSVRPSVRLAQQLVPSLAVFVIGFGGALGFALGLGLGVDVFPMVSLLSLRDESDLEGPGVLLLALLSGDRFLLRWTMIGLLLAWLPTYRGVNELSWNLRSIRMVGPPLFWAFSPVRMVLWWLDVAAGGSPVLRSLTSGAASIVLFEGIRSWLRTG